MAITINETVESREALDSVSAKSSTVRTFTAEGSADEQAIIAAVLAATPATWGDLDRGDANVSPTFVDSANPATSLWRCSVEYVSPEELEPETGDSEYSFETGGGKQHITQSLANVSNTIDPIWVPERTAPDFDGAIGVTEQAVEGTDIIVPVYNWAETHYLPVADVDLAYKLQLFASTGTYNDLLFKGMAAGECLFRGASGSQRGEDDWKIRFSFSSSPNMLNIIVGGITVPAKLGWEYLWIRYEDSEDGAAHTLVKKPLSAHVEKVYNSSSFALLGIGV